MPNLNPQFTPSRFFRLLVGAFLVALFGGLLGPRLAYADTYIVTTADDSGPGSLRQAILDANVKADLDLITFNINALVPTIKPLSPLPAITAPVVINALGNQPCDTFPPQPRVVLDGALAGATADGLQLQANGSSVIGLAILRFSQDGIDITATDSLVACTIIGLDRAGAAAGNGQHGVRIGEGGQRNLIGEDSSLVGYPRTLVGNIIGGNGGDGIRIEGSSTTNNDVIGNFIGVTLGVAGTSEQARPNAGAGIRVIDARHTGIGSIYFKETGNRIAYNGQAGIVLAGAATANRIQSNQLYSNGGLGIDLGDDGVTLNDPGDGDSGVNERQNFPVITEAYVVGDDATVVLGTLNSLANTRFRIEIFANPTCDASGFGEGAALLGETEITLSDGNGNGAFTFVLDRAVPVGSHLVATAESIDINEVNPLQSSEFSACRTLDPVPPATANVPIARKDSATTPEDTAVTVDVLTNDSDPNNDPLTIVGLGVPHHGTAQVVNNQILYTPPPDFSGDVTFFYSMSDGTPQHIVQTSVRVTVTPVNDPPFAIKLDHYIMDENLPANTLLGTLGAVDVDDTGSFNFILTGADNDNAAFQIAGNQLLARTSFDFESKASYTLHVRVSDRSGATFEQNLSITINNTNDAPTAINLSHTHINENQAAGLTVGNLTALDPDAGDSHTYALVSGAGSDDNVRFRVEGATLKTNALLDYEAKAIHSIRLRSSDRAGAGREQIFAIYLINLPVPPDVINSALTFCSGNPIALIDVNANDAVRRVLVRIDAIALTNKAENSCTVNGKLTIISNGSSVSNLAFSGNVNSKNQFSSSTIPDFMLTVAGLPLQAGGVQIEYYQDRPSLRITSPQLKMPAEWGGLAAPLALLAQIDSGGVKFGAGTINLPTISTKSGFELDLSGSLVPVAGGYQISADGELSIPNLGKKKTPGSQGQSCSIQAGVTIYAGAQGETVMVIAAGNEPAAGDQTQVAFTPDTIRLDKIRAGFSCDPGIAVANTGFFLTELNGEITLTPDSEAVNVQVKLVAVKQIPVIGPVIHMNGTMDLTLRPDFKLDLSVVLKMLTFEMSNAKATVTQNRFSTTFTVNALLTEGSVAINAWSADGRFHFTGSGKLAIRVAEGAISNSCTSLPCPKICWAAGIPYPCGFTTCRVCVVFPPFSYRVAEVGVAAGEFTNNTKVRYGFKGYMNILGKSVGFFIDENRRLTFGNVEHYYLVTGPTVAAAHQAWAQSLQANMSINAAAFAPYTFLDENAGVGLPGGVIIRTPLVKPTLDLAQVRTAQATDVISKVNLIPHADVGFTLKAHGPLGFTLITPQGLEVTPANYQQSGTLGYHIVYTQSVGYEPEASQGSADDPTLPTLRFTPLASAAAVNDVDVQIDGATAFGNVNFTTPMALAPVALAPGVHTVTLVKRGTNTVVLSQSLTLITATTYSLLTVPLPQSSTVELVTLVDDTQAPASFGMAKVRFYNATATPLNLLVNDGPLFTNMATKAASSYALVAAGTITVELRATGDNTLVSQPLVVKLAEGGVYTFFSVDYAVGGYPMSLVQRLDAGYVRSYLSDYTVDQAQTGGEWQVKLVGDTDNTFYLLAVTGPASPPVLASVTVAAGNPAATQVNWRLTSDLQPTRVTLYINPGPISQSIPVTAANGTVSSQEIPLFTGYPVAEYVIRDPAQLGGQLVSQQVDLSKLASGTYHLWLRADDGVNPPVDTYAAAPTVIAGAVADEYGFNAARVAKEGYNPLLQLAVAAPILIDHAADFPTVWTATISTTLDSSDDALYVEWPANPHPDVDNYRLYVGNTPLNPTQVITTGGAVVEYDANGLATGVVIGFTTLEDIQPGLPYYLSVEAVDSRRGRRVRSQESHFSADSGRYTLATPQTNYAIAKGGQLAIPVTLTELQPLFYPQVGLALALGAAPLGLTASFQGDVAGNSVLSGAQPTATLQVAVDAAVADGRYPVKVLSYNGATQQTLTVAIVVGDAAVQPVQLYLPLVAR